MSGRTMLEISAGLNAAIIVAIWLRRWILRRWVVRLVREEFAAAEADRLRAVRSLATAPSGGVWPALRRGGALGGPILPPPHGATRLAAPRGRVTRR